jgi:CRISPR-associated protein Csm3
MLDIITIRGKILLKSGLHIGSGQGGVKIGGVDSPVMRNPLTDDPYIPGSSLKGKMRFLLEWDKGIATTNEGNIPKYDSRKNPNIPKLFGNMPDRDNSNDTNIPTMVTFRDSQMIGIIPDFTREELNNTMIINKLDARKKGLPFYESKYEVNIDRIKGTVNTRSGGPRQRERVVAGAVFEFEIGLRLFGEDEETYKTLLKRGLELLQQDTLGGSGSRGYGRIRFFDLQYGDENWQI